MIKVVFTYVTEQQYIEELMNKFQQSADPKFNSAVTNTGIHLYRKEEGNLVYFILDIFYDSFEDYETRTAFERSQDEWNEIWFNDNNHHTLQSIEVLDVLS